MALTVSPTALTVGDHFTSDRSPRLRVVTGIRVLNVSGGDYSLIDYINVDDFSDGNLSLRHGSTEVQLYEPVTETEAVDALLRLNEGETLTVHRGSDDRLYR